MQFASANCCFPPTDMPDKDVLFGDRFSVTYIKTQGGFECDECGVHGPCFVFEREREKGGGWWHQFCLSEEQFREVRSLVERANELLEKRQ